jgi:outer membrane protein
MNTRRIGVAAAILMALAVSAPVSASGAGTWVFKIGAHNVNPDSDNGSLAGGALDVEVDSNTRPTFGFGYWLSDTWQIDLLAAVPFNHDFSLNGADAGEFKHLPPTLSLQYHFNPGGTIRPFVGLGVNYTIVYDEESTGPIAGADLGLDNSFGLAAQVGLAFQLNEQWSLAGDVRWLDIDSDASVDGVDVGTVNVDPIGIGIFATYDF